MIYIIYVDDALIFKIGGDEGYLKNLFFIFLETCILLNSNASAAVHLGKLCLIFEGTF